MLYSSLRFLHRYLSASLTPSECALTSKHRVLPIFSRNRRRVSALLSALATRASSNLFRIRTYRKLGGGGLPVRSFLEVELQRQLYLSRVEYGARRPVQRVRRTFQVAGRAGTAKRRRIHRAEIRG